MATVHPGAVSRPVPTPSQLAALGTVLCLHRSGAPRELGGWSQASRVESHAALEGDGMHESLHFYDADDACCWQLHLLPDSDFLGWERLSGQLPRCSDVTPRGVGERLWRGLARRIRGGAWEASVLRFQAVGTAAGESGEMLVASLGTLSPLGIDSARRIARGNGIARRPRWTTSAAGVPPLRRVRDPSIRPRTARRSACPDAFRTPRSPTMKPHATTLAIAALLASTTASAAGQSTSGPSAADRAAILAMQGEYTVRFLFDETVVLRPEYTRKDPKRSGGDEVVVVEDTPTKIVLQHLLLDVKSGHVIKHWRQDWMYEAPQRWEFAADQTWRLRDVPADRVAGGWTQCVFEVSDAPRYCGTGRWDHANGTSTWTSDAGWRPLPRREYTTREDCNALAAINRHTIVPGGWTHEQDNRKDIRDATGAVTGSIVRETGFNDYVKTDAIDFTPAYDYWKATQDYWARVRARWETRLASPDGVHLKTRVDGMALIVPFFEQAQTVQDGGTVSDAQIDAVFAEFVDVARD